MSFYIEIYCADCTGEDFQGCFEGSSEQLPERYETKEAAELAAIEYLNKADCGPWRSQVHEEPETK